MLTYLKERIKEVLTGAGATIVVRLFGPDLDVLRDEGAGGRGRRWTTVDGRDEPEGRAAGRSCRSSRSGCGPRRRRGSA